MAGSVSIRLEQASTATPTTVYDVLLDADRWAEWLPTVSAASWDKHGAPDTALGGVRRVRVGMVDTHDTVVDGSRPHHHAYVASLPVYFLVTDYRGDVRIEDIEERPGGSHIVWTVTCTSRIPGLERLLQWRLRSTYARVAAALAREAERQ